MSWISELMKCESCDSVYGDLLLRSARDEVHQCVVCCELTARRIQAVPNVSTAKTSVSTPDVLPKRFDKHRRRQELKKELQKAKQKIDKTSEGKIRKELNILNK